VSRHLAEDRCDKQGHLLAYVDTIDADGSMVVSFRFPMHDTTSGKVRRSLRDPEWQSLSAATITNAFQAFATCGCRDDHSLDLADLLQRASRGETKPKRIHAVQRS